MGIKTSKMMIQRDSDKWQRPQDIASLLSRTARGSAYDSEKNTAAE